MLLQTIQLCVNQFYSGGFSFLTNSSNRGSPWRDLNSGKTATHGIHA